MATVRLLQGTLEIEVLRSLLTVGEEARQLGRALRKVSVRRLQS